MKDRWGTSEFIHPKTIAAIPDKLIARSSFIPKAPTNLKIDHQTGIISWDESLCATNYIVKVKIEDKVIETINVSESQAKIKDNACSDYEVFVTAVTHGRHTNNSLNGKIEPPTISADQLELEISPTTHTVKAKLVRSLPCVVEYLIKLCQHESCRKPVIVQETQPVFEVANLDPCSSYKLSVESLLLGENHLKRIFPFSTLPQHGIYNLTIQPSSNSVELTWDHDKCTTDYRIRVCKDGSAYDDCYESDMTIKETSAHKITKKVLILSPCTPYTVNVFAINDSLELEGETKFFETHAAEPTAPKNFCVSPNNEVNKVNVSFNYVECAAVYRIYQIEDDSAPVLIKETKETSIMVACSGPSEKYRFGVSAVVGNEEGPKTTFVSVKKKEIALKRGNFNLGAIIAGAAVAMVIVVAAGSALLYHRFKMAKKNELHGSNQEDSIESGRPETTNRLLGLDEETSF